ncbi:MAG: hypothetical protein ABFD69_05695 [Candidatus Sumerlaeia bacterium]
MSRSIHQTRKMLSEIMKYDFGDNQHVRREKLLAKADLERKRRIKSRVKLERGDVSEPVPPTPIDQIPIIVRDEGPFVHYPATPDDIRAIMHRLPPGSCDKLRNIEFTLDRSGDEPSYMIDKNDIGPPDPYIGRFTVQRYPGVYDSGTFGVYDSATLKIQLYGYVYAPDLPNRSELEIFLKCHMLSTFVHEIAHHQDRTTRIARGRWRMDQMRKGENYAELWQSEWVCDCAVPYINETYPVEVNRLLDWLENETGIRLTLAMLYGERLDGVPCFIEIAPIIKAIAARESRYEIQKKLVREMWEGYFHERALEELDRLLPEHESDHEIFRLKGRVLRSLEQFDTACEAVRRALAINPADMPAWDLLVILNDDQKDWPEAVKNAECAIALYRQQGETGPSLNYFLRAAARMKMGDLDGAQAAADEMEAIFQPVKDEQTRINALMGVDLLRQELQEKRRGSGKR